MSRLSSQTVDRVRERTDIIQMISRYVELRRAGHRYKGLCPFHTEKTPSFHVDEEKQLYYCFGCQAGGDVFNFLMQIENASFPEVLSRLADEAGLPPEEIEPSPEAVRQRQERETLAHAVEAACAYYEEALKSQSGYTARAYLQERGIPAEAISTFRLGYAPDGWRRLREHLTSIGISEEVAVKAGLLGEGSRGPYDRFRDRLIFPIADVRGKVIGFGGRALKSEDVKYINSPESALYIKRNHLYGLNVASSGRRRHDRLILVEGYTDVISLHVHGITNVVASLGTAFTAEQAKLIKRFSAQVIMAYDTDRAGETGTLRGLDLLAAEDLDVRVARLPQGEDPDSFIRRNGKVELNSLFDEATPLYEYKIDLAIRDHDLSSVEGRVAAVNQVVPILSSIDHAVAKEGYITRTAEKLNVSLDALTMEVDKFEQGNASLNENGKRFARPRPDQERRAPRHEKVSVPPPARPIDDRGAELDKNRRPVHRKGVINDELAPGDHAYLPGERRNYRIRHKMSKGRYTSIDSARDLLTALLKEPHRVDEAKRILGDAPFVRDRDNALFGWLCAQGKFDQSGDSLVAEIGDDKLIELAQALLKNFDNQPAPFEVYLRRAYEESLRLQLETLEARLEQLMIEEWMTKAEINRLLITLKSVRDRLRFHVHLGDEQENAS